MIPWRAGAALGEGFQSNAGHPLSAFLQSQLNSETDPRVVRDLRPATKDQIDYRRPDYASLVMRLAEIPDESVRTAIVSLIEFHLREELSRKRLTFAVKRLIDIAGSAAGLVILAIPLLLVALAIKITSPGQAIFVQTRHGRRDRLIRVLKFRTMYSEHADPSGVKQTAPGDVRVTPLGRFLRRTNIDELPQLWNVLVGDMSLVGPRPHPIGMLVGVVPYQVFAPGYHLRHLVRPGITGLAQVTGLRGETRETRTAAKRLACDIAYVGSLSFGQDARILGKTFVQELRAGSGY
jgi:lipopolysaccharide/colanic/teichoic acid biosynthesis glycosyltransferase